LRRKTFARRGIALRPDFDAGNIAASAGAFDTFDKTATKSACYSLSLYSALPRGMSRRSAWCAARIALAADLEAGCLYAFVDLAQPAIGKIASLSSTRRQTMAPPRGRAAAGSD